VREEEEKIKDHYMCLKLKPVITLPKEALKVIWKHSSSQEKALAILTAVEGEDKLGLLHPAGEEATSDWISILDCRSSLARTASFPYR
jgi:hypothetical protein